MRTKIFKYNNIKKIGFNIILFFVIFSINFNIPAWNITIITGIMGGMIYFIHLYKKHYKIRKSDFIILGSIVVLTIIVNLSSTINQQVDSHIFSELIILNILRFFSAFFLVFLYQKCYKYEATFTKLIFLLAVLLLIQQIIAICMFVNPSLFDIFNLIFKTGDLAEKVSEGALGYRPFGLGAYRFFGAGIINCFVIVSLAYIISTQKVAKKWIVIFFVINIVGTVMARTTLIGSAIAIVMMILTKQGQNIIRKTILATIILIPIISIVRLPQNISDKVDILANFGFELFINYFDTNSFESKSTNKMMQMYVTPDNTKTWIIGDAQLRDGEGYYKGTDIGYLRLIYCFGIIGLGVFLTYQLSIALFALRNSNKKGMILFFGISSLILILLFKGLSDLSLYLFIMYFSIIYSFKSSTNFKQFFPI